MISISALSSYLLCFGSVAAEITDKMSCIGLALEIGVSPASLAVIEGKQGALYTTQDCHALLMKWWKRQQKTAGAAALYDSLCKIGKKAIAESHKDVLIRGGGPNFICV